MMLGAGLPDSGYWHHHFEGRPPFDQRRSPARFQIAP